jgi:hypothetical protein
MLLGPAWARDYLRLAPPERPWGTASPCALGLIGMLLGDRTESLLGPPYRALLLWASYVAVLIGLSLPTLRRLWRAGDRTQWVMAGVVLYCLLAPRVMAYGYLMAVPPAFALVSPVLRRVGGAGTVAGLLGAQAVAARLLGWDYRSPWLANLPFLLLLGFWLAYALVGARAAARPPAGRSRA